MEEAAIIEQLTLFGLSRQEAAIYLCLLQNEELTGYEVAKLTGISRSNVYNGLASLVEHGAAALISFPRPCFRVPAPAGNDGHSPG